MRYRLFDHTSDIKVEIYGRDLSELFANAAYCIGDLMLDIDKVETVEERKLEITSPDLPELFLDWLRELLFLFSTHGFAVRRARVRIGHPQPASAEGQDADRLTALLRGQPYDPARHGLKIEVKTPTYHEYKLERLGDTWRATLILDV